MTKLARLSVCALAFALAGPLIAQAQDAQPFQSNATETKPVLVFAAASLKNALERIAENWKSKTGKTATLSFAASSALAKQIESGAPADLFISADLKWMDWSAERKLIDDASRKNLLGNALVLIAPKDSATTLKIEKGFALADALGNERLAMGQPDSVPAGIYGKTALTNLGVWDVIEPNVAGAENVRVALAYVARGETPLGIVYATDAKSYAGVKVVDTFPADSHPPVVYPVAVTASSTNAEAKAFLEFLSTPDATKVFEDAGFTVLK
ncbi:molybdate ABC transporter substrate-binding protein [Hyphomicrobium sp. CS1GBMeth3]|uniref:molybdate ABC transporter substrate-binding protein n=1 Tax=Hyphomicrobium sp. CS1GBMeth3 TaxID=1892845 RepID=UPI0009309761|nr:molybdate ABC transporter substrate-binding protein [Hyphomicrobium sp. CS1GBMeth3]